MTATVYERIAQLPLLRGRSLDQVEIKPLSGLTNSSFRLNIDGELYVFRVPGECTKHYLERCHETHNTKIASDLGLAPELCWVDTDSSVTLTRYLEDSRPLKRSDFQSPTTLDWVADTLARLHNSGRLFRGRLKPFNVIDEYLALTGERANEECQVILRLLGALGKARALIEKHDVEDALRPCHIDPNPSNFLLLGDRLWLIDWEYSAMCHPLWDLACLALEADLDPGREGRLLERYRGADMARGSELLAAYRVLVSVVSLAWTAVQIALCNPNADFGAEFSKRHEEAKKLVPRLSQFYGISKIR